MTPKPIIQPPTPSPAPDPEKPKGPGAGAGDLVTDYRFTCARCGIHVAGFDVEPPPSWAKCPGGWLCEDCKDAFVSLRSGANRAPACPPSSVPSVAQGETATETIAASPHVDSQKPPAGRNGAAGGLSQRGVGR